MKVHPAHFASVKRAAIRALAETDPGDYFVPDTVRFINDDIGFIFRLGHGDAMIECIETWTSIGSANVDAIPHRIKIALADLAAAVAEA